MDSSHTLISSSPRSSKLDPLWLDDATFGDAESTVIVHADDSIVSLSPSSYSPTDFTNKINSFLSLYTAQSASLQSTTDASIDQFKFTVVGSNQMVQKDTGTAGAASVSRHVTPSLGTPANTTTQSLPPSYTTFSLPISTTPYYGLIHSLQGPFLARSLLHYAKSNQLSTSHIRLCILLSISILNMHLNASTIALSVYLRMANNRLEEFLRDSDVLDSHIRNWLQAVGNGRQRNQNTALRHLFGSQWTHRRHRLRSGGLLVKSVLNTLILTFNERLTQLIPLIDDYDRLSQYLQYCRIDLGGEDCRFLTMLNRPSSDGNGSSTNLRPLRLRSMNCAELSYLSRQMEGPFSSSKEEVNDTKVVSRDAKLEDGNVENSKVLSEDAKVLARQFTVIRKVYLCCVMVLVESARDSSTKTLREPLIEGSIMMRTSSIPISSATSPSSPYIRKFNLDRSSFRHLTTPTRIFVSMKFLQRATRLIHSLSNELDDEVAPVDSLNGNTIAEESENENVSELVTLLDSLSYKVGLVDLNCEGSEMEEELKRLGKEFERLFTLYGECSGGEEPERRESGNKRRSSGLSFGLVSVVNKENGGSELEVERRRTLEKLRARDRTN